MKKLLSLILAALMLFSITACNTIQNISGSDSENTQNTVNNNESADFNIPSNNIPSDSSTSNSNDALKIGKIVDGYHEGLMFTENTTTMAMHPISCIDKTGKTVFSIEASYIISGFHNGLAFVMQEKAVLCDKTGKIITAQELGGTFFDSYNPEIFEDGYILVNKTTTSFQGSVNEMAVFNSNLEKIVDFSSDLYNWYNNDYHYGRTGYYNGYLFDRGITGSVLDLRTGERSQNLAVWVENMELKNETDFWLAGERWNGVFSTANGEIYFIYDKRDYLSSSEYHPVITPVLDLSQAGGRIRSKNQIGTGFVDGYAALVFEVMDSEVGERHYFTILGKDGNYCFEPVEIAGLIDEIKTENGIFVLSIVPRNRNETTYYIEVYDISGRIGVKEYQKSATNVWSFDFDISDGVIFIQYDDYNTKEWIGVYKTDMQPLFDVEVITESQ